MTATRGEDPGAQNFTQGKKTQRNVRKIGEEGDTTGEWASSQQRKVFLGGESGKPCQMQRRFTSNPAART